MADLGALAALYAVLGSVPALIALAFVVPAAVTLGALAWFGLRPGPIERLEVSAPSARWRLGDEVPVTVVIEGEPGAFVAIEVALRGEEVQVAPAGKGGRSRRRAFHAEGRRLAGVDLTAARTGARRWSWNVGFRLPEEAPASRRDTIEWSVEARVPLLGRIDPEASLRLEVAGPAPGE